MTNSLHRLCSIVPPSKKRKKGNHQLFSTQCNVVQCSLTRTKCTNPNPHKPNTAQKYNAAKYQEGK